MKRVSAFPLPKLSRPDQDALIQFLCDLIAIPSISTNEEKVIRRIEHEMLEVGFKRVWIDRMGNLIGQLGIPGGKKVLYQAHADTIGVGSRFDWRRDPYEPLVTDEVVWGRGASDSKQAIAAMVYGAKILADRGVMLGGELFVAATVQEEECEGLALQTLVRVDGIRPDYLVVGEATGNRIQRGHLGRVEMAIAVRSPSCNTAYQGAQITLGIEELNRKLKADPAMGKGSIAVTGLRAGSGTGDLVPDRCTLLVDRRLTLGEGEEQAVQELEQLAKRLGVEAEVEVLRYEEPSWRGYARPYRKAYPPYLLPENHELVQIASSAVEEVTGDVPEIVSRTSFTDGNCTAGIEEIPAITFGPGNEAHVHTFQDQVSIRELVDAANSYALMAIDLIGLAD
ncbi:MAG: YgeY family selenium metabolism-linked hydrolase [Bacteroidota bacterium]